MSLELTLASKWQFKTPAVKVAATKPYLDPVHVYPWHPEYQEPKPKPEDWISITHSDNCGCSLFSKREADFFDFWQSLHLALRHSRKDSTSYAFYPEFEYETGEALAHASLTANLGLRQPVPKCYARLTQAACRRQLKEVLKLVENVTEVSI
ncbi:hypothetical protein NUW58_g325 [Xylaria curta]|uniref:Uncharacterized protein n=1 Tax=Xylaria curta TaxID=42375 RepID=A0ACC1PS76_9PEZI|nr:hypothetical protein NUW58_g325 [Xylaria curta]